jgi:hypothetical protein
LNKRIARRFVNRHGVKIAPSNRHLVFRPDALRLEARRIGGVSALARLRENSMRKILFTALGAALIALAAANAARAAERHHARRATHQHEIINSNADARDSHAEFGQAYRTYDARAWGGAISAPAGR